MKNIFILSFLFFCFVRISSAQAYHKFLVDSAHWTIQESVCVGQCDPGNPSNGDYHYNNTIYLKLDGDTIVQGRTYKKLTENSDLSCYMCPNNGIGPYQSLGWSSCKTAAILWEDSVARKVYANWFQINSLRSPSCQDSLLFDFSRVVGDSMYWATSCTNPDSFFVDRIVDSANVLYQYNVKTWYLSPQVNWDGFLLYESIGSSAGFWGGSEAGFFEGLYSSYLLDYCIGSDSACGFTCLVLVGINTPTAQRFSISVFPNPAKDILSIELSNMVTDEKVNFRITDILGREIYSLPITESKSKLDMSGFKSGIYLWQLLSDQQVIQSSKIAHVSEN